MPNKPLKSQSIKSYFIDMYLIVFFVLFLTTTFYNGYVLQKQVTLAKEYVLQKISKVIQFNKNELLEELILGDIPALQQHLNILQSELGIDDIELSYQDIKLHTPGLQQKGAFLLDYIKIPPEEKNIANDYGNLNVNLKFTYAESIFQKTVLPLVKQALLSIAIILLATAIVFFLSFIRIQKVIMNALTQIIKTPNQREKSSITEIQELQEQFSEYELLRKKAVALEIGRTVAHDIKSPIFALKMLLTEIQDLPEEKRLLLKSAITRIYEIAENLTKTDSTGVVAVEEGSNGKELIQLACIIENIVSEKTLQIKNNNRIDIEFNKTGEGYGLFSTVQASGFRRVLSNLINNSIESIFVNGKIKVILESVDTEWNTVRIIDNGRGIPNHILPNLMKKGATFSKKNGSGLGLYSAKNAVESWGGKIQISSTVGRGTEVKLLLPKGPPPIWFKPYIWVCPNQELIVVDDDPLIHRIWEDRLSHLPEDLNIQLIHIYKAKEFSNWLNKQEDNADRLYLIDQEFRGENISGLNLIRLFGLQYKAILVTNRYDDKAMIQECNTLDVKLIPKLLATSIPLKIERGNDLENLQDQDKIS